MGSIAFANVSELDTAIENIIDNKVENYRTDWTNYDRPKYRHFKKSRNKGDKRLYLLARECGTYLLRENDVALNKQPASTIYEFFTTQEPSDIYMIDIEGCSLERIA